MDATPVLVEIGRHLKAVKLETVLIGNAAAALQGAPVTTVDLDFLFRKVPRNLAKLRALARRLGGTILRPYYPASDLFRLVRESEGLQIDFMSTIHGMKSFEGIRDRATPIAVDNVELLVASLADIIRSKRAARRPQDLAVLPILERALEAQTEPRGPIERRRPRK
jgi:hypothetical protein